MLGRSLAALLYACLDGTGEIREILTCATFSPRLPGTHLACWAMTLVPSDLATQVLCDAHL
jgi:hypothetical protein